jgi:hypothetical protein
LQGEPLNETLNSTIKRFEATADVKESVVPRFTSYVLLIVAVLFVWVLVTPVSETDSDGQLDQAKPFEKQPTTAIASLAVLVVYVAVLGQGWLPFAIATALMVFVVANLLTRWNAGHIITIVQVALLTGLGTQFVFTEIFTTVLP